MIDDPSADWENEYRRWHPEQEDYGSGRIVREQRWTSQAEAEVASEDDISVSWSWKIAQFLFPAIYCLDKIAHKLGYCPPTDNRFWWCEYAEDRLFEIAGIAHDNDGCFWCRRYYKRATWDDGE